MHRFLLLLTLAAILSGCQSSTSKKHEDKKSNDVIEYRLDKTKITEALSFAASNNYNQEVAFLLDIGIRSGRKRFFVVDLNSKKQLFSGLVTHGHCQDYSSTKPQFSNESGSNCTSLGKYRIGVKYSGQFGTAYKLHGLEKTNSNAFERFVVLHAHDCVPDYESAIGICRSEGCPTVSPLFLKRLEPIIDKSERSILLWIFNS